jgi:hypothetical protein
MAAIAVAVPVAGTTPLYPDATLPSSGIPIAQGVLMGEAAAAIDAVPLIDAATAQVLGQVDSFTIVQRPSLTEALCAAARATARHTRGARGARDCYEVSMATADALLAGARRASAPTSMTSTTAPRGSTSSTQRSEVSACGGFAVHRATAYSWSSSCRCACRLSSSSRPTWTRCRSR